jgi:hypothetical protein
MVACGFVASVFAGVGEAGLYMFEQVHDVGQNRV